MPGSYGFSGDDAEMNAAMDEARRRLPEFRHALDLDAHRLIPRIEGAIAKVRFESPITHAVEHAWIEDAGFDGDAVVGTLSCELASIPEYSKGGWISAPVDAVSDWAYREGGRTFGGFTVRVMQRRGLHP